MRGICCVWEGCKAGRGGQSSGHSSCPRKISFQLVSKLVEWSPGGPIVPAGPFQWSRLGASQPFTSQGLPQWAVMPKGAATGGCAGAGTGGFHRGCHRRAAKEGYHMAITGAVIALSQGCLYTVTGVVIGLQRRLLECEGWRLLECAGWRLLECAGWRLLE